jgi:hypothetical protein
MKKKLNLMQIHLHEVKILQIHNAGPELVKNITAINQSKIIFGVIKQIYHVWEGYLRKIPVLRLNFPRHWLGKFFVSRLVFFHKYPSQTWYICIIIKRTTDNVLQILLQASRWRVKTANTILQIPWKKS